MKILDHVVQEHFVLDPLDALTTGMQLTVRAVDSLSSSRGDGGFCDGMSFLEDGVILYAPTPNSRRQNFTLAHELGHWIVEQDEGLFDWIADQSDPPALLETVCDHIAQRLLLPEALIAEVIGDDLVRAHHIQDLFDNSQASYQACAIAISRRIRELGAVVLIDRVDGQVAHASIQPEPDDGWPVVYPWRGQTLPDAHALRQITPGRVFTRRITWRDSWGRTADFYADAIADDRRIIAVLAGHDIWKIDPGYMIPPRDFDTRPLLTVYCCGQSRTFRGYPCVTCGKGFCPVCKNCQCDRIAKSEEACTCCYMLFQRHLLVDGLCESCR
ncbi:ImmA/IrrE family metallo-endopeptidase [Microbacterium sp. MYb45]|uniref:ImmA/IrrE family metallo-endopeptidase n=1 Tax=Microbacterium sp. MYb45 TaxID=1827294 RepID=UPI0015E29A00|nr:ImmA/IrrE family metallo-endopeptidase [Microbacterium sp. MYb45]